jgi:hypothetical protein
MYQSNRKHLPRGDLIRNVPASSSRAIKGGHGNGSYIRSIGFWSMFYEYVGKQEQKEQQVGLYLITVSKK